MKSATLTRLSTADDGTFGQLVCDAGLTLCTAELPWLDNLPGKSCIPPGTYKCNYRFSPSHNRKVYHVDGVPGRTDVEIHAGNYAGDVNKGLKSDVLGCIILGETTGMLDNGRGARQFCVVDSKTALDLFEQAMNGEDFMLDIRWKSGLPPDA